MTILHAEHSEVVERQHPGSALVTPQMKLTLFVHRASQQWVVLDQDGDFWILPSNNESPWDQRQPFTPTEENELEPIPGHYKYLLGLPF
jgi:hypothetical protein